MLKSVVFTALTTILVSTVASMAQQKDPYQQKYPTYDPAPGHYTTHIEDTGPHDVDSYKNTREYQSASPSLRDKVDMRMHPEYPGPRQYQDPDE